MIQIRLQASNGCYVHADGGGGSYLIANETYPGPWKTFGLANMGSWYPLSGDWIVLQAYNGMYACAEGGGGGALNVNRTAVGAWEGFQVIKLNDGGNGRLRTGDVIALRTNDGHYVRAVDAGYSPFDAVTASYPGYGGWETFNVEVLDRPAFLRRMVTLGPAHIDHPGGDQDPGYVTNDGITVAQDVAATNCNWVKLWISWPKAQPRQGVIDWSYISTLANQIATARRAGLGVILGMAPEYPRWANGTAGVAVGDGSDEARMLDKRPDAKNDYRLNGYPESDAFKRRVPEDYSANGPWGQWVSFVLATFNRNAATLQPPDGYIDFFEIANEPNQFNYPQVNLGGVQVMTCIIAGQIATAQQIANGLGPGAPMVMGPGTWDGASAATPERATGYSVFTGGVSSILNNYGFTNPSNGPGYNRFCWTMHDYGGVENGYTRVNDAFRILRANNFQGYGGGAAPAVWITEAGYRLDLHNYDLGTQSAAVSNNFNKYADTIWGTGVASMCNYLDHAGGFDTGLRQFSATQGGVRRPVWYSYRDLRDLDPPPDWGN